MKLEGRKRLCKLFKPNKKLKKKKREDNMKRKCGKCKNKEI
jgi:hypothetical protein